MAGLKRAVCPHAAAGPAAPVALVLVQTEKSAANTHHNATRTRGMRVLTQAELKQGDVSLAYVSRLMHRAFRDIPLFRKVLQCIWHQVNHGQEIYVVGQILEDGTVKGGTGWGAEFAKLCNKPLFVFAQDQDH